MKEINILKTAEPYSAVFFRYKSEVIYIIHPIGYSNYHDHPYALTSIVATLSATP